MNARKTQGEGGQCMIKIFMGGAGLREVTIKDA